MTISAPLIDHVKDIIFAKDAAFWNNYLKGRPSAPPTFFDRLFRYHHSHGGQFNTVHDVGAGNGPYAHTLRSQFSHVIVSDIAPKNVALAQSRLGTDGFSYRAARVEDGADIPDGSVDMVFATNVMHFCDQRVAMEVIARQLRSGGTFACAGFGTATFEDERVQDVYARIHQAGGHAMLRKASEPVGDLIGVMARTGGTYNVAPLDEALWLPGAQRVRLNMEGGGLTGVLPSEVQVVEPLYAGLDDVELVEREKGWEFVTDLEGLREHVESFPFAKEDPGVFEELWKEMEDVVKDRSVKGHWPAKVILATRR